MIQGIGAQAATHLSLGESLVVDFAGRWDDVEEDGRRPHGLTEHVLCSDGGGGEREEMEKVRGEREGR